MEQVERSRKRANRHGVVWPSEPPASNNRRCCCGVHPFSFVTEAEDETNGEEEPGTGRGARKRKGRRMAEERGRREGGEREKRQE